MSLARGALSATIGDSLSLPTPDAFVLLDGTNLPGLETELGAGISVSMPSMGTLRYDGAPATLWVSAELSTLAPALAWENFLYRIAKNGTTLAASEQLRSQGTGAGYVGVSLTAIVSVAAGDLLTVAVASSGVGNLVVTELALAVQELASEIPVSVLAPVVGDPWPGLEAILNRAVVTVGTGQSAVYSPLPAAPVTVPVVFDLDGYEVDLTTGIRVTTGIPELGVNDADIGRPAAVGDLVTVAGRSFVVKDVTLSGQVGFSKCRLRDAA